MKQIKFIINTNKQQVFFFNERLEMFKTCNFIFETNEPYIIPSINKKVSLEGDLEKELNRLYPKNHFIDITFENIDQ